MDTQGQHLYLLLGQLLIFLRLARPVAAADICGGRPITGVGGDLILHADCSNNGLATIEWSSPPEDIYRIQIDYQCFPDTAGLQTAVGWSNFLEGNRGLAVPENASCVFYGCYRRNSGFEIYNITPVHCLLGNKAIASSSKLTILSTYASTTVLSSVILPTEALFVSPTEALVVLSTMPPISQSSSQTLIRPTHHSTLVRSTHHHTEGGIQPMSTQSLQGKYSSTLSLTATPSTMQILKMDDEESANSMMSWYIIYILIGATVVGFLVFVSIIPVLYYCKRKRRKYSTNWFLGSQIIKKDLDLVGTREPSITSEAETILAELWSTTLGNGITENNPEVESEDEEVIPEDNLRDDSTTTESGSVTPELGDDITEASLQMSPQSSVDGDVSENEMSIGVEDERDTVVAAITALESYDDQTSKEREPSMLPTNEAITASDSSVTQKGLASLETPQAPTGVSEINVIPPQVPLSVSTRTPSPSPDNIHINKTGYWEVSVNDSGNSGYLDQAEQVDIWSLSS